MKQNQKTYNILFFLLVFVVIVVFNLVGNRFYFRLDLTSDQRYTLKKPSKEILHQLDDVVYIEVYLAGELTPDFEKFKQSIRQHLEEYKAIAGKNVAYKFINPADQKNEEAREDFFKHLSKKGLKPMNIHHESDEGEVSQKLIFPGAILRHKGRYFSVNLLQTNAGNTSKENINNSVENLEYELITAIHNLMQDTVHKIAFLEGHGELGPMEVDGITRAIAKYYQVDRGRIDQAETLQDYKALFIAKPQRSFSEKEKFAIDQYIMNGGHVFWFLDKVSVDMDSLATGRSLSIIKTLNLEDQLFKYGARLDPILVQDLNCNVIPLNTAPAGQQAQFSPMPWTYDPLLLPKQDHPVTKNLDLIKSSFVSIVDTLTLSGVDTEVLLTTSEHSKKSAVPGIISLEEATRQPDQKEFVAGKLPVGVLLEGIFPSVFQNRSIKKYVDQPDYQFKDQSVQTSMAVIADGDIIRNDVKMGRRGPQPLPLGYDRYTKQTFDNQSFIINLLHYMTDDKRLLKLRSKAFQLRLLNQNRVKEEKIKWQLFNTVLPSVIIVIFTILLHLRRRRKYTSSAAKF